MDQEQLDKLAAAQTLRLQSRTIDPKLAVVEPIAPPEQAVPNMKELMDPVQLRSLGKTLLKLLKEGAESIEITALSAQMCAACLLTIADISDETKRLQQKRKNSAVLGSLK